LEQEEKNLERLKAVTEGEVAQLLAKIDAYVGPCP